MPRSAKLTLAVTVVALFVLTLSAAPAHAASERGVSTGEADMASWAPLSAWWHSLMDALLGTAQSASPGAGEMAPSSLFDKARVNYDPDGALSTGLEPAPDDGGETPRVGSS